MEFGTVVAIHPIFVHFAIALTLFGVGLEVAALLRGRSDWHQLAKLNLVAGGLGIAAAVLTGWWDHERWHAAVTHHHGSGAVDLMNIHQYLGVGLLITFAGLVFWRLRYKASVPKLFVALALLGAIGIAVQGYIGGQLVFQEGTGVMNQQDHPAMDGTSNANGGDVDGGHEEAHEHDHSAHDHE